MILFLFFISSSHASDFEVTHVEINCSEKDQCNNLQEGFKSLKRKYLDLRHLRKIIKLYVSNEGVREFQYKLVETEVENKYRIQIRAAEKEKVFLIEEIKFKGSHSIDLPTLLPIREEDFLDERKLKQTQSLLLEIARDKGFPQANVQIDVKTKKNNATVSIYIDLGTPVIIRDIEINSKSHYLAKILESSIGEYEGRPVDIQLLRSELEKTRELFIQFGYYLSEIEMKIVNTSANEVVVNLDIVNVKNYTFFFQGIDNLSIENMKSFMASTFIGFRREMSRESVVQSLSEEIESYGYRNFKIDVKIKNYKDDNQDVAVHYNINIKENERTKIKSVDFKGNSFFSDEELRAFFFDKASSLARNSYHDKKYYDQFSSILKEKYLEAGFVSVFVDQPIVNYIPQRFESNLVYRVREGIRAEVQNIKIQGVSQKEEQEILALIENKKEKYFNPLVFQKDLEAIQVYLKNQGYYFAEILNINSSNLITYKRDNSKLDIYLDVDTGFKLFVDEVIIIGNKKTRKILIKRELGLSSGDIITSSKIESSQSALLSLGIFSQVQIQPVSNNRSKTDLLVFVREKDFGLIEVAPGIRSDLGLKFSTTVNYNNLDGMNKRVSLKASMNRRLNLNSLESSRRKSAENLLEYDTTVSFAENNILYSEYDFYTSFSGIRRRFFSFDADIQRVNFTVSRDFVTWFSAQARYQLERISQYNATLDLDGDDQNHGHFQIGSITPAVTFDFRDRSVNTTKGAVFDLSCEFANPTFLSQKDDELTVDYYKLISRNKFYYPMSRDVVLALSTAFGIQENRATKKDSDGTTEGYIPGLKVFRLSGADIVRGYEDNEINRLFSTNDDISKEEVNKRAYMVNVKFEPRLYLSDSTIVGVFYDAGRVFVDKFEQDELRSSVGFTFKYLTPVGSLDFDYGIKLLRKRDSDGTLDSPGRLHVSIGFF